MVSSVKVTRTYITINLVADNAKAEEAGRNNDGDDRVSMALEERRRRRRSGIGVLRASSRERRNLILDLLHCEERSMRRRRSRRGRGRSRGN